MLVTVATCHNRPIYLGNSMHSSDHENCHKQSDSTTPKWHTESTYFDSKPKVLGEAIDGEK